MTPFSPKSATRHPSDINKIHICSVDGCKKSFNRPAKLNQHLRSHTNTRPFVCLHSQCSKDFLRDSHLKHHVKSAHTDVREHVCVWEGCTKSFLTATRLRRHLAAHEGREAFTCAVPECGQAFRKHATLQAHIAKVHERRKPFVCVFLKDDGKTCKAGFDTAAKLRDHEGRLHEVKRYTCTICTIESHDIAHDTNESGASVAYSTYSALQDHMAVEHPPTCTDCAIRFSSQATLKTHIEMNHGNFDTAQRRTHFCHESDCEATFTNRGNLNVHLQTIHGDKRFVCGKINSATMKLPEVWDGTGACGSAFTSKARLIDHIKTAHLGIVIKRPGKTRKEQKRSRKKVLPTLTGLTGSGYAEESGRHIACLMPQCEWRFLREYDHEMHLQSHHGLADLEIQAMRMDNDFGELCPHSSLQHPFKFASAEDIAAETALDAQYEGVDEANPPEDRGQFWLGDRDPSMIDFANEWPHDEMEMHRLIHDEDMEDDEGSFGYSAPTVERSLF